MPRNPPLHFISFLPLSYKLSIFIQSLSSQILAAYQVHFWDFLFSQTRTLQLICRELFSFGVLKMIGEFVTASLILVLGYAYPALQCFKSMEKNRVEIQELRFWCQYWIIVAILTILERVGDVLVSWIPIYGEMKLALFIFLWYPKTKGSGFIYESMLRPYVRKHEIDIERSLLEFRDRAWNLAIYFWDNCTELGSTKILQFFQSTNITPPIEITVYEQRSMAAPPPTPPSKLSRLFKKNNPDKRRVQEPYTPSKLRNQQYFIRPEDVIYS